MIMSNFLKNYAENSMTQVKRLIVSPENNRINFEITIEDIWQDGLTVENKAFSSKFYEVACKEEWGGNCGVEVQITLTPVDEKHRITKDPLKEYAARFTINCFSFGDTPADKQAAKELFQDLAESDKLHIHSTDYYVMEE